MICGNNIYQGITKKIYPYKCSRNNGGVMKPHPALTKHYNDLDSKQAFLRKVFDESAKHYEGIARWGWFNSGDRYRREALKRAGLEQGMKVIDVGAGTGQTARAAASIVGSPELVTVVEPSRGMLEESKKQLNSKHIQAVASDIPVPDNSYDFLTMGFALRHVDDLDTAFREYFRVLKPGGKVFIMDVTLPSGRISYFFTKLYFKHILPFLTRIFTGSAAAKYLMSYYWETMEQMVDSDLVIKSLEDSGFTDVKVQLHLGIFSEYEAMK